MKSYKMCAQAAGVLRSAVARAILPHVNQTEVALGEPVIVAILQPSDPLVRQILPDAADAYAAAPPHLRASTVLVAAAGGWSAFTVANEGFVLEDGAERWYELDAPEPAEAELSDQRYPRRAPRLPAA